MTTFKFRPWILRISNRSCPRRPQPRQMLISSVTNSRSRTMEMWSARSMLFVSRRTMIPSKRYRITSLVSLQEVHSLITLQYTTFYTKLKVSNGHVDVLITNDFCGSSYMEYEGCQAKFLQLENYCGKHGGSSIIIVIIRLPSRTQRLLSPLKYGG